MPKAKSAPKKPAKASARPSSTTKKTSTKKAVVSSGGRNKHGFWTSLTSRQWILIGLVIIVVFGGLGAWRLYHSNAATFTSEQCWNVGRVWSNGACSWSCVKNNGDAGTLIKSTPIYYCTNANSTSVSATTCANLGRDYNTGAGGCAREWRGTFNNRYANSLHCRNNTYTYVNASSSTAYDKCVAPTTSTSAPSPAPSTSWIWPVPGHSLGNGYSSSHMGIDIPAPVGTAVKAAHSGSVVWRGTIPGGDCGTGLIVKASSGVYLIYQHISPKVSVGQTVATTTTIGTVASLTKNYCWTGPHVHVGIQNTGSTIYNPTNSGNAGIFTNPCVYLPGC